MYNTLHTYLKSPKDFRARTWFPAQRLPGLLRCMELWVLLFIVVVFMFKQLSHATSDLASGVIEAAHLQRFQHVTFALFFLTYVVAALISENSSALPLPDGVLQATFALGFLMELVVFHFGHHPGHDLESFVHMLMQVILVFLVLLMLLEILWPKSILIAVGRCMLLIFKGTWFFQIGLLINFPFHTPLGCTIPENKEYPICATTEADLRAKSLQVLIFNWQAAGIVVGTYIGYAILLHYIQAVPVRVLLPSILTPRAVSTPRSKEQSVYFAVPEDGEHGDSGSASDGEEVDADGTPIISDAPHSLSRRISSRNTRVNEKV